MHVFLSCPLKKVEDLDNFAKFEFLGHSDSYGNMSFQVSKWRIQSYIILALDQQIVKEGRFWQLEFLKQSIFYYDAQFTKYSL